MKAAAYARQYGYFTLGSSDCHVPEKVGVCATYFPNEVRTMDEFLTEFKKGQMKPAYYVQGGYRVLEVQNNDKKVQNKMCIRDRSTVAAEAAVEEVVPMVLCHE